MIATKEFMISLCRMFDISTYTAGEATTEAFITWYLAHGHCRVCGGDELCKFDVESVLACFNEDLKSLYEEMDKK